MESHLIFNVYPFMTYPSFLLCIKAMSVMGNPQAPRYLSGTCTCMLIDAISVLLIEGLVM